MFLRHCLVFVEAAAFSSAPLCLSHTITALTLYRQCSPPPSPASPPSSLSLPVSALLLLLACIRCVSQAASQQQTFGEEKHGLRTHTCALVLRRGRIRRDDGIVSESASLTIIFSPRLGPLLPSPPTLPVWMFDCRFDGAEQARLIEGLRPGGICGAAERDNPLPTGATVLCPLIVNGLRFHP